MSEMFKAQEAAETSATPATQEAPALIIAIPETNDPALNAEIQQWAEANNVPTVITDAKLRESISDWGLPWFRAGVFVVNGEGKILMIHEGRVQVKKIKDPVLKEKYLSEGHKPSDWVDGDGGWNCPAGRLNPGEMFEDGGEREVGEESGWNVTIKQYLCKRTSEKPGNQYFMPVFIAEPNYGPAEFHTVETRETLEIAWLTPAEIRQLHAEDKLRSPEFVMDSLHAYEAQIA